MLRARDFWKVETGRGQDNPEACQASAKGAQIHEPEGYKENFLPGVGLSCCESKEQMAEQPEKASRFLEEEAAPDSEAQRGEQNDSWGRKEPQEQPRSTMLTKPFPIHEHTNLSALTKMAPSLSEPQCWFQIHAEPSCR